jgi:hypothetical protein
VQGLAKNHYCGKRFITSIHLFTQESGMAVRFILGRSGTGKTHHCVKAIVEALSQPVPNGAEGADNQHLVLLVPEQATY